MDAHRPDAFGLGLNDHRLQVIDVAMHVAVGKETDEMHYAAPGPGPCDDLLPGFALPDRTVGNRIGDQRRALAVNLPGADGVVADFGIAHVVVGRHADGSAVGAQANVRVVGEQAVECRLAGGGDGAASIVLRQAVAIHDDDDDRPLNACE